MQNELELKIAFINKLIRSSVNDTLYLRTSDGYTKLHSDTLRLQDKQKLTAVTVDYSYRGQRFVCVFNVTTIDNNVIVTNIDQKMPDVDRLYEVYSQIEIRAQAPKKTTDKKKSFINDDRMEEEVEDETDTIDETNI